MYFLALATDYDGTIALRGTVDMSTRAGLQRLKQSGRRLIMVTGREVPDLKQVCCSLALFDAVVAENGAVLYRPDSDSERVLAPSPPACLVEKLREVGVKPLSVGRSVIATWEPHQGKVLEAIHELGLEWQIVFNKGAVMALPSGVNKRTGLLAALAELGISANNVVAVGDAENDHAFLSACGCSAVVANGLPSVREEADIALLRDHGAGVVELIDRIIRDDAALAPAEKHGIAYGLLDDGTTARLVPKTGMVLIVGPSGIGKTSLAVALTEEMAAKRFEFCVVDPEGDYIRLRHAVAFRSEPRAPMLPQAIQLLRETGVNLVLCTQGLPIHERQDLLSTFLTEARVLRAASGRPHWLLVDEAHQVLHSGSKAAVQVGEENTPETILATVVPDVLSTRVLRGVGTVLALGSNARDLLYAIACRLNLRPPMVPPVAENELVRWNPGSGKDAVRVRMNRCRQPHVRHRGKYALGDVGSRRSFYFRGSDRSINRPANNLFNFLEIATAVGDEVWLHHLRAGDYSAWFRHVIKDEPLAELTDGVAGDLTLSPEQSRQTIAAAILDRYAGPADGSVGRLKEP